MSIEIQSDEVDITPTTEVKVIIPADSVIETATSTQVELIPDSFVLTSTGIFTGNLDGSVPIWLVDAINLELTTGEGNLTDITNDLVAITNSLDAGVTQNILNIQTIDENVTALETAVVSRLDGNDALIYNLQVSSVDETSATAISTDVINSTFNGNVDAYIGSIASTYVDANSAIAADVSLLSTSVNGVSATISEISIVSVDEDEARAKNSLIVDVDGSIAGYVAQTDGTTSEFIISADIFKVSNGTTNYTPLTVNTVDGRVEFNGYVTFTGLGLNSDSTTINGGLIETDTLSADTIIAGGSISSPIINGGEINGTTIIGATITGSVIRGSWIDYISSGALTNWQHYTPASPPPSEYLVNFAHDNETNDLVVDVDGYYRLSTVTNALVGGEIDSWQLEDVYDQWNYLTIPVYTWGIATYNSYTISTSNRVIQLAPTFIVLNTQKIISSTFTTLSAQTSSKVRVTLADEYFEFTIIYVNGSGPYTGSSLVVNGVDVGLAALSDPIIIHGVVFHVTHERTYVDVTIDAGTFTVGNYVAELPLTIESTVGLGHNGNGPANVSRTPVLIETV